MPLCNLKDSQHVLDILHAWGYARALFSLTICHHYDQPIIALLQDREKESCAGLTAVGGDKLLT